MSAELVDGKRLEGYIIPIDQHLKTVLLGDDLAHFHRNRSREARIKQPRQRRSPRVDLAFALRFRCPFEEELRFAHVPTPQGFLPDGPATRQIRKYQGNLAQVGAV